MAKRKDEDIQKHKLALRTITGRQFKDSFYGL